MLDPKVEARLKCRYYTNNVPYLLIQPVKMEEASLKPYIVVFHEVISDDEIDTVKKMAQPRVNIVNYCNMRMCISCPSFPFLQFRRATVQNHKTGELEPANYRISKSAWLKSEEHKHVFQVCHLLNKFGGR